MTAITLHLPDDLAVRLAALPDEEVNATAALALADLVDSSESPAASSENGDAVVSAEEAAYLAPGIRRGLQAAAEGRVRPAEAVFADFEARYGRSSDTASSSNGTAG